MDGRVQHDGFGRDINYLRIAVTDKCNFRCVYCMPADGVAPRAHDELLSAEEIARFVRLVAGEGIRRVRLTGGEPLVSRRIIPLIRDIRAIPQIEDISLTTNGALLPKLAPQLKDAGLNRVNISLDTLDPTLFGKITRLGRLEQTMAGIDAALAWGFEPVKVNCVVVRRLDQDVAALARLTVDRPIHLRFIEYMPIGDEHTSSHCAVDPHAPTLNPELWDASDTVPSDELRVRSVGHEAKAVIGRAPGSIVAVRPLKDGVIADFDVTAAMLQSFIRQACGNSILARPRVVICVPSGVTEVERRAVRQAAAKAGARQVTVIEEPMAAAIGSGLPTTDAGGSMIVDIGGGTAEIAVISLGGIVASRSVRMAGDMFDQAIIAFIKRKYNLLIGERTAEQIKIEIGSAYALDPELTMEIKGRNLVDGLPKNIVVHSEDVRGALLECLVKITTAIKETLERTPPELSADIIDRGITLTGGGALLRGLDQLIQSETGIDVHIAEDPLDCVAKGAGAVLDHVDVLHDVLDTDGGHM